MLNKLSNNFPMIQFELPCIVSCNNNIVSQSVKVANHYLTEHQNAMRGEILKFANQLNINAIN